MKMVNVIDLSKMPYGEACRLQKRLLADKKLTRGGDYLLLLEHPNVFTIGRTGSRDNILADADEIANSGISITDTDRGGDITFHGTGQLVAYPIFDLNNHTKDVRLFIRNLERALELVILEYGLVPDKKGRYTGLWVSGKKICFIGIGISGWITYHGVSINANTDLKYFSMIQPCGIEGMKAGSLKEILKKEIDINSLKEIFTQKCKEVFGFERIHKCSKDAVMAEEAAS